LHFTIFKDFDFIFNFANRGIYQSVTVLSVFREKERVLNNPIGALQIKDNAQ